MEQIELSLEQQFNLRSFETQVERMSREQAQDFLIKLYKHLIFKEATIKRLIKHDWEKQQIKETNFLADCKKVDQTQEIEDLKAENLKLRRLLREHRSIERLGWAYTCSANLLIYFVPQKGTIYILNPETLRWYLESWRNYPEKIITNKGYRTIGLLIPLREIETIAEAVEYLEVVA